MSAIVFWKVLTEDFEYNFGILKLKRLFISVYYTKYFLIEGWESRHLLNVQLVKTLYVVKSIYEGKNVFIRAWCTLWRTCVALCEYYKTKLWLISRETHVCIMHLKLHSMPNKIYTITITLTFINFDCQPSFNFIVSGAWNLLVSPYLFNIPFAIFYNISFIFKILNQFCQIKCLLLK